MARYQTNEPTVNCSCGITFATREFRRVPTQRRTVQGLLDVGDEKMWDRHCPNCNTFWGAAPYPIEPNIFNSCFENG